MSQELNPRATDMIGCKSYHVDHRGHGLVPDARGGGNWGVLCQYPALRGISIVIRHSELLGQFGGGSSVGADPR